MLQHAKSACKSFLLRFGYEIRAVRQPVIDNVDYEAALTVKESQYYSRWLGPCPLFSPWLGHPEFQAIYEGAKRYTVVSPDRCYILISLARYASHLAGDFAECGVYRGGTALLLARVLGHDASKRLYLFDSFQGLPKMDQERDPWFSEGQYCAGSVRAVEELLSNFRSMMEIRRGWIPETFPGLENNRYAFAHLDVDLYQSTLDCCKYFYSRLVPGGVLLFDEYGFAPARGEKDAVDEFFADKPESPHYSSYRTGDGVESAIVLQRAMTKKIDMHPASLPECLAADADEMFELIRRLYPICRSITGDGVRQTLRILQEHIPLTVHEVPSHTPVFDWTVLKEWNIRDAYIKNSKGEKIVDFHKCNLHVLNYSLPVRRRSLWRN